MLNDCRAQAATVGTAIEQRPANPADD